MGLTGTPGRYTMSHITKRGTVCYFRRKTPADLLAACGRRETIYSLGTADKRETLERARAESVKLDRVFARLRTPEVTRLGAYGVPRISWRQHFNVVLLLPRTVWGSCHRDSCAAGCDCRNFQCNSKCLRPRQHGSCRSASSRALSSGY
jgi:hypothetical protein